MSDPSTPPNSGTKRQYVSIEDDMDDFGESGELAELSPEVIKAVQESPIQLKVVCEEFVNQKDIRSPDKRNAAHQSMSMCCVCRCCVGSAGQKNGTWLGYLCDLAGIQFRTYGKSVEERIDQVDRASRWFKK